MNIVLDVNSSTCIKCGKCVRVCPSMIFTQSTPMSEVSLQNVQGCIACGHCVAVCPTSSVSHSDYPTEKVHRIDRTLLPTPAQIELLCRVRRSNRAFSGEAIPTDMLEMILDAAHRAPTASNAQQVEFTLITDPARLREISDFTVGVFASVVKKLENPLLKPILRLILKPIYAYLPNFRRLMREQEQGNDLILRGAKAVILIHTPASNRFGSADANLAYQNGSLMAESLGVSQFYTGFVCSAIKQDRDDKLAASFGIKGKIHAGMALGMPSFKYANYIDRKEIRVNRF